MFLPGIHNNLQNHRPLSNQSSSLVNNLTSMLSGGQLSDFSRNSLTSSSSLHTPMMQRMVSQLAQQALTQIQSQSQSQSQLPEQLSPSNSRPEPQTQSSQDSRGSQVQDGRGRGSQAAQDGRGSQFNQNDRGSQSSQDGRSRDSQAVQDGRGRGSQSSQDGRGRDSQAVQDGRGRGSQAAQDGRGRGSQINQGPVSAPEFRSIDGTGNNLRNTELGSTDETFRRVLQSDPTRAPGSTESADLPGARAVSNAVSSQTESTQNSKGASDMFWLWGQFLDHDITLSEEGHGETANIAVPEGDPQFDPRGTGTQEMRFTRSESVTGADGQNNQINTITAFIDGSNVYGSDQETADSLRSFEGGKLILTDSMMPQDERGHFMAGDVRANENPGLTSMHTLWAREHNRIADELAGKNPDWGDERLYQEARNLNAAQMQAVTYNEFLPMLLGDGALPEYEGYNPDANPEMSNAFVTSAYRFGHSMVSSELLRLDEAGNEIPEGNLGLRDAFFQPERVMEAGIDPILRGASSQTAQEVDTMVVDDLRNVLFGAPGSGGMDLAALNIQRGRDHELPGYNDAREQLGLPRVESFDDPIWKDGVGARLAEVYDSPDDVDLWVAGLAEKPVGDAMMGETNTRILTDQFTALRDGDRFWYENQFSGEQLETINNTSLADIIRRNSDVDNIQDEVMVASNSHLK